MVFSLETIQNSNKSYTTEYSEFDDSSIWFEYALNMVLEESKEFNSLILSEKVQQSVNIKNGKYKEIDIKKIFSKIFDWFMSAIEQLLNTFISYITSYVKKTDAKLYTYKKQLANYDGSIIYKKKYYDFKNLDMDTSRTSYRAEIEKEYNSLMDDLLNLSLCKDNNSIESLINNIEDRNRYEISYGDMLRGRVVGTDKAIPKEDFAEALFNYFRISQYSVSKMKSVDKELGAMRIHQAYNEFINVKKQESKVNRDYSKLINSAKQEKRKIMSINLKDFLPEDSTISEDIKVAYNRIVIYKCLRIKEVCETYCMLFSAKIDALRDYNDMNKEILSLTCNELEKGE